MGLLGTSGISDSTQGNALLARLILAPFMIHELFPSLTETASGSHPCCVVSVTYDRISVSIVVRERLRRSLSVARGATATFGTGMKLLDESAEFRIGLPSLLWVGGVYKLVAVVVHLHSAARANHLVSVGHSSHLCLCRSVQ